MERFYLFFLGLFLWGNASGIGVWNGVSAQQWRSGGLKSLEGSPSFFPAQRTSSLPSAVQSFEVGAMHAESISNSNTRLVSWKPNVQGGSFSSGELNLKTQGAASGPVSAQSLGSGAGLPSQYTAVDQNIQRQYSSPSKVEGVLTAPLSYICGDRRRQRPFTSVPVSLKPEGPTHAPGYQSGQLSKPMSQSQRDSVYLRDSSGVNDPGFVSASASERQSSQASPKSLWTLYFPASQTSRPVAPSQILASLSKPPQQGNHGVQSSWYDSQGQSIPSASRSTLQAQSSRLLAPSQSLESAWLASGRQSIPSLPQPNTQASSIVAPSQSLASESGTQQGSYGAQSGLYTLDVQSIPEDSRPTFQTPPPWPVAPSQILPSASKPPQQSSYDVQSSWYPSQEQSNPSTRQYAPVFQTQSVKLMPPESRSLANQYTSISQSSLGQTLPVFSPQVMSSFQTAGNRNGADIRPTSFYAPLQDQDVQASWFDPLNQVPDVQPQSFNKPVFPALGLVNQYNFPSKTWIRSNPSRRAQWYRVTHAGLEALQANEPLPPYQSLYSLSNQATSGTNPPVSQSQNSQLSFGLASQNQGTPTSTYALTRNHLNLPPVHPTMLQVPQTSWP